MCGGRDRCLERRPGRRNDRVGDACCLGRSALHGGPVREVEQGRKPTAARTDRPHSDGSNGPGGARLDSGDQRSERTLHLFTGSAGLSRAANLCSVFLRSFL